MHTRKDVIPHVCTHRQYRFKMGASQKDKLKSAEMSDPRGGRNLAIPIALACRLLLCMSSRDSACYATIKMRPKMKGNFFSLGDTPNAMRKPASTSRTVFNRWRGISAQYFTLTNACMPYLGFLGLYRYCVRLYPFMPIGRLVGWWPRYGQQTLRFR